jgi:hypothetical protein
VTFIAIELAFGEELAFHQPRRFRMKYLLEEPNGNLHEISVPKNAAGQICYEKVNTCDQTSFLLYISEHIEFLFICQKC